jgi:hypothetical protein
MINQHLRFRNICVPELIARNNFILATINLPLCELFSYDEDRYFLDRHG